MGKYDNALDDIVKQNRSRGNVGGKRRNSAVTSKAAATVKKARQQRGGKNSKIARGGRGGGGRGGRANGNASRDSGSPTRRGRGGRGGRGNRNASRDARSPPRQGRSDVTGGKTYVHVANLDFSVSQLDMQELFGEFGKLLKVNMHFNQKGKSQGTCEVVFARKQDAAKAMKKYNGVPLDGRKMSISIIGEDSTTSKPSVTQRLGRKPSASQTFVQNSPRGNSRNSRGGRVGKAQRGGRGGSSRGGVSRGGASRGSSRGARGGRGGRGSPRGGRGARGGRGGAAKKPMTEEDLDKQLDAYLCQASD